MIESPCHARILVIGHSCLDSISIIQEAAPVDGKLEADRIWVGCGGPAANAAIALRRLGHEVRLATRFADDDAGGLIGSRLRQEGISLLLPPIADGTSSLAQIRATGAERSIVWRRGKLPALEADRGLIEDWMDGVDLLYVDGHEVAASSLALQRAAELKVATVADPGSLRPGAEDWPALLDSAVATPRWLSVRYPEAASIEDALARLEGDARDGSVVGVTLGSHGGIAIAHSERLTWRARKIGAVDTTAAGDAFHAGLADALLQGLDLRDGLDWAATLAAAVCRSPGNQALPTDRAQLQLWHGRWGQRPGFDDELTRRAPAEFYA